MLPHDVMLLVGLACVLAFVVARRTAPVVYVEVEPQEEPINLATERRTAFEAGYEAASQGLKVLSSTDKAITLGWVYRNHPVPHRIVSLTQGTVRDVKTAKPLSRRVEQPVASMPPEPDWMNEAPRPWEKTQ